MKMQNDLKWIPSIDLEESCCNNNSNCSKKNCYKSLSDYLKVNKDKDSRSRSCVFNSVREESYSIIDIINEFAPLHNVEIEENDLYPSKARSQRWPLSKKQTKLSPMLWYNTQIIVDNNNITINDNDECMTKNKNINGEDCNENAFDLDDLWFAAGKTMELPPTPIKDDEKQCEEEDEEQEQEEQQEQEEIGDGEEGETNHTQHVISRIISDLISIPFDEQPLNPNVQKTMNKSTSISSSITSSCSTLSVPRCDMVDGTTTRSSSLGSEADIKINYSSSNILYENEPSSSYIIDDANTPIPPNEPTNTSALYEFLFDGVDTDSDDDVFGTSFIEMNQRKSIPFEVKMVRMGGKKIDGANCPNNTDTKDLSNTSDNKEEEEEGHSENNQLQENKLQHDKPETYVPCRPLWELIK